MLPLLVFGSLVLFMVVGIPCAFGILLSSLTYLLTSGLSLSIVAQRVCAGMNTFVLLAIPLFTCTGYLMEETSLSRRLTDMVACYVGKIRGSAGIVTIVSCAIFAALTGSGPATVAAIGAIMIPSLIRSGYKDYQAAGIVAAGGGLGPIIPPSTLMIVYGATMGVSVSKMFVGGVIPGIVIVIAWCILNGVLAKKWDIPVSGDTYTAQDKMRITLRAIPALVLPVMILGGIYGGIVTPTEAAVLSTVYGCAYGLISKELDMKRLWKVFYKTGVASASVIFVISTASVFSWVLSRTNLPAIVGNAVVSVIDNKYLYMLVFVLLLYVVGCLMDGIPSVLILSPILSPIAVQFGWDPLHVGCLFCICMCVGFTTPPFGINLFTAVSTTGVPYEKVLKGSLPYTICIMIVVLIYAFCPWMSTIFANAVM